jgi:hypothetical protein
MRLEEEIMEWISQNWVWVLFFVAFIAMHLFGHGGHGAPPDDKNDQKAGRTNGVQPASERGHGHHH